MVKNYKVELASELEYFNKTITYIELELGKKLTSNNNRCNDVVSSRREMWNDTVHSIHDSDESVEVSQYLQELNIRTSSYISCNNEIEKLKILKESPYFARIDFKEDGCEDKEKIYIGCYSFMDDDTCKMFVFDWRSPIASIFYRFGSGNVEYKVPDGIVYGKVSLKRQYEIKFGKFEYFFDANVQIVDEFLRRLLSKNASSRMTSIVETIQRDQDIIIRDSKNDLLMVQGVAGSGKTSVALHRAAYLMYHGLKDRLSSNNIVILSPNSLFAKYISNVLPELGEDNVKTLDFEDILNKVSKGDFEIAQTRNQFFEKIITCTRDYEKQFFKLSMEFKTSDVFVIMLKRLILCYERKLIPIEDVYYNGKLIFKKNLLKSWLLKRDSKVPVIIRLEKMENMILEEIRRENKQRIMKLEKFADRYPEHMYEARAFSRMISIHENRMLLFHIRKFTRIDYMDLYYKMYNNKDLFYTLAKGLKLPQNVEEIRQQTMKQLVYKNLQYEDALGAVFLKVKMTGYDFYKDIKQVIIDEAQDYYPIHFEILKSLYLKAKYTILGDINQTIEKQTSLNFYDQIKTIFNKKRSALLTLKKSFRCTSEIICFSEKFIDKNIKQECFSRKGTLPKIIFGDTRDELDKGVITFIKGLEEKTCKSICILCKSIREASELYGKLQKYLKIVLIDNTFADEISGISITSIYMAKGLEFDAVVIYNVDDEHYKCMEDKKLLYIASTRALHKLALCYTGKKSKFLN